MQKLLSKKTFLRLVVLLIVIGGLIYGYWWINSQYDEYVVKRGDLKLYIASTGKVEAEKKANLDYNYAGWITELPVKENDLVKKGQIVAKIDSTEAGKNLSASEAAYRSAKADLEKVIDDIHLFQYGNGGFGNVGSPNETQTQKTNRQKAEEAVNIAYDNLQKAKNQLSKVVLKSPFDGVVTKVNAELNESTSAFSQVPLVQIVDFSTLFFEAEIDQENSGLIKMGQTARVTFDAQKEKSVEGTVYEVASSTRNTAENDLVLPVKIKLPTTDDLKLGWVGDVTIDLKTIKDVLLIPKNSVEYINGKSSVRVKTGFFTKTKPVSLGEFDGVNWQVNSGLNENEIILLK